MPLISAPEWAGRASFPSASDRLLLNLGYSSFTVLSGGIDHQRNVSTRRFCREHRRTGGRRPVPIPHRADPETHSAGTPCSPSCLRHLWFALITTLFVVDPLERGPSLHVRQQVSRFDAMIPPLVRKRLRRGRCMPPLWPSCEAYGFNGDLPSTSPAALCLRRITPSISACRRRPPPPKDTRTSRP